MEYAMDTDFYNQILIGTKREIMSAILKHKKGDVFELYESKDSSVLTGRKIKVMVTEVHQLIDNVNVYLFQPLQKCTICNEFVENNKKCTELVNCLNLESQ